MPSYDRSVFEGILKLCGLGANAEPITEAALRVEDDGVFAEATGFEVLDWMPAVDADAPGSPNPLVAPLLSFPFTAAQLAAFLLDGWGWFIYEALGSWETGPDEDLLRSTGVRGTKVREAVHAAYRAGREAQKAVGPLGEALQSRVVELGAVIDTTNNDANRLEGVSEAGITHEEYEARRARAREATADMEQLHEGLNEQAADEAQEWRKAMVRHLLGLGPPAHLADQQHRAGSEKAPGVLAHTQRKPRRDLLTPVIERARAQCTDELDVAEIWPHLQRLAEAKVPPFLGVTEDGLQYRDGDNICYFTRLSLYKRIARMRHKGSLTVPANYR